MCKEKTKKVVIHPHYGAFCLSEKALNRLRELGVEDEESLNTFSKIERDDPRLVQVVEELGAQAHPDAATRDKSLKIVEIPADVEFSVEEYDGKEWIAEKHRIWDTEKEEEEFMVE